MSTIATNPATSPTPQSPSDPIPEWLLLIGEHSVAFRASYALPVDSFTTSTGQPTSAVHGLVSMFLSLLDSERPTHVAVVFDLPGGTFRTKECTEYKGTRDETPQPFLEQVGLIREVLEAMGVTALTAPGHEADDILAALVASAQAEGMEILICPGDRDSFQTAIEWCTVPYSVKSVLTLRRMTPQEVEGRYGAAPECYPHLAALVGETSDNLPGVPGMGPRTAAKWLNLYDGLGGVIAYADQIKGKAGQSLCDHLDDVMRNRCLNHLLIDLDLGTKPHTDLCLTGVDRIGLACVFESLEFHTLHQRVLRILSFTDASDHAEPSDVGEVNALDMLSDLEIVSLGYDLAAGWPAEWLEAGSSVAEGDCPRPSGADVVGVFKLVKGDAAPVSLSDGSRAVTIDLTEILPEDEVVLTRLLADVGRFKLIVDAKGNWRALSAWGLALGGVIADPSPAGYLCRLEQRSYDVEALTQRWLDIDLVAANEGSAGGDDGSGESQSTFDLEAFTSQEAVPPSHLVSARQAAALLPLQAVLDEQMAARDVAGLFIDLEMPVAAILIVMEDTDIAVDDVVLHARQTELDACATHAAEGTYAAVERELSLSSLKQLQAVLFDGLKMPRTRKTKTGYITDADALAGLCVKTSHSFLEHLLEHRDVIKLRQTAKELRKAIRVDGRIHTTFQQTIAATGRLPSTDPNLQSTLTCCKEGMRIREAFTVGEGYERLMTADYSQIEMRIMAYLSAGQAPTKAFRSGEDLHCYVAVLVHGIEVEDVTTQQRSHAKAMNYGLAYDLSTFGLVRQLGIDNAEAADLRNAYFIRSGKVHDYLESVVEQARRDGYTETMFGRRRYLPDLTSDNQQYREMAERAALNVPIQGDAADIVKKVMIDVDSALREQALMSRILLQTHGEPLIEAASGEAEAVENLLKEQMGGAAELLVFLDVVAE